MNALVWISIVFSPLFDLGIALRADQLFCPLLFGALLVVRCRSRTKNHGARWIFAYALVSAAASLAGIWVTHNSDVWSAVKWPLVFITNLIAALCVVWSSTFDRQALYRQNLKVLQWLLFLVGLIGLMQVAENRNLLSTTQVTDTLATYYPYWGELTDAAYDKSFGRQLKVGGAGQLTSVVDGHSILAGDLLAFGLLITMPLARGQRGWLLHVVPIAALLLTLSRGSIIPWFFGVSVYSLLETRYSRAATRSHRIIATRLIGIAAVFALVMLTPLGDSVLWRVESSIDTFQGTGVQDARTEKVWPEVIEMLGQRSKTELIFGLGDAYDGPTDSQYLLTLVNQGLIGIAALLALHVYLLIGGYKLAIRCLRENRSPDFAFAFIAAISALLLTYMLHPAYQNRRLLTMVVVIAVLLFEAVPRVTANRQRKDIRREAQRRPSLQRAFVG